MQPVSVWICMAFILMRWEEHERNKFHSYTIMAALLTTAENNIHPETNIIWVDSDPNIRQSTQLFAAQSWRVACFIETKIPKRKLPDFSTDFWKKFSW